MMRCSPGTAQSYGRALLGPTSLVFRYASQKGDHSSDAPTRARPRCPRLDREKATLYKRRQLAQVAQLVEHCTENAGVGGSIPPLGTSEYFGNTLIDIEKSLPRIFSLDLTLLSVRASTRVSD
jgi:hypothetical protein